MDRIEVENRLLRVLATHHGRARAIGMGELYESVYGERWSHRINDTRRLRELITRLKLDGIPICSVSDQRGGGYFLASAGSDLDDYCRRLRLQALKKLAIEAKLRRVALPELLGQISMALERGDESCTTDHDMP